MPSSRKGRAVEPSRYPVPISPQLAGKPRAIASPMRRCCSAPTRSQWQSTGRDEMQGHSGRRPPRPERDDTCTALDFDGREGADRGRSAKDHRGDPDASTS